MKAGKSGHGKSSGHDARNTQREQQRLDKYGKPLNYGPFKNGYYVADKKPTAEAQAVGIAAEQVAALSLLTTAASSAAAASASTASSATLPSAATAGPKVAKPA